MRKVILSTGGVDIVCMENAVNLQSGMLMALPQALKLNVRQKEGVDAAAPKVQIQRTVVKEPSLAASTTGKKGKGKGKRCQSYL